MIGIGDVAEIVIDSDPLIESIYLTQALDSVVIYSVSSY